jgi:hypothetical protein
MAGGGCGGFRWCMGEEGRRWEEEMYGAIGKWGKKEKKVT